MAGRKPQTLKYTNLANSRLAERVELEQQNRLRSKELPQKDTFHYLLNSKDSITGKGFTKEQLQADSALIIAVGSDGVGLTVSTYIFYLLHNPRTLSHLINKICGVFKDAEDIGNLKLGALPYPQVCVDETLRMCPPKASSLPREVLAGGINRTGSGQ